MRRVTCSSHGFTVIELIAVLVIITIIVTAVIPSYLRAQQRAIGSQALQNLHNMRSAELLYHHEMATFITTLAILQSYADFSTDDGEWTYTVTGADATSFTAQATRNAGKPNAGFWIRLAHDINYFGTAAQSSRITYSSGSSYPP